MTKSIGTKNRVLIFLALSLMLFMAILIGSIYLKGKKELEQEKELFAKNTTIAYKNVLNNYETIYKSKLESVLNIKGVMEAIERQDRVTLHKLVEKRWHNLKRDNPNIKILHFHKANGLTLLRMHNPTHYGDDIAKKRAMCTHIHKHQKFVSSFEVGVNLLGYRIMFPIFHNNSYLGAIEIGVKPNFVLKKMKESHKITGVIFAKDAKIYDKKPIENHQFKIANYRAKSNTLEDKSLINMIPTSYKLDSDTVVKKGDRTYAVYLFDHMDFKGEISAKTLILNDITAIEEGFTRSIIEIVSLALLLYLILLLAVKIGFEKILDQIDRTNRELEKNVAFLKSHQLALDESNIVTKSDLDGNIIYANENFYKITGFLPQETIGKPHNIVRHPDNSKELYKNLWSTIKSKKVWKSRILNRGPLGDYWVDIVILPILDDHEEIVEYIAVRHNITQMIQQQARLDTIANTDILTGYGSRYKLNNDILKSSKPALAILNIDSFSQINDFYGHQKGDEVIKKLGIVIEEFLIGSDYELYHLQGDEFVVFHQDIIRDTFVAKIREMSALIPQRAIEIEGEELFLNLSTAISFEASEKILITADMALKIAKKENRNIVIYTEEISLNEEYQNNIKWSKKVKEAIENDNIVPVFQPIINNANNAFEKYESLVRLEDEGRLVSPYFFLDISKRTKHYIEITKIMIQKSFDTFKDKSVEFSINLTIEDILNPEINLYLVEMLESYQLGSRVVFEIVESESIENFEEIHRFIEKIKSYGCKIAIDDFGTGYSNFEYLMRLNVDYIKIDGSLIKDITSNQSAQIVVSMIVEFAQKMQMKTIAEFVENEAILNKIKELGVDYSQGYHFSAPKRELGDKI